MSEVEELECRIKFIKEQRQKGFDTCWIERRHKDREIEQCFQKIIAILKKENEELKKNQSIEEVRLPDFREVHN